MATEDRQRQTPERILVVTLDSVGDLVFASALLPPLRNRFPSAHIAVWCKDYASGLAPLLPAIDFVYCADPFWDRAPGRDKGSLAAFLKVLASIRRARFDMAILAFAPWRTAAAVAATRIPVRIGLERRRNRRWLTQALPAEDRHKPVLAELGRLLEALEIDFSPLRYRLDVARLASEQAAAMTSLGHHSYVALHPFASHETRCVKLSEWAEVARQLSADGMAPLWIGTEKELERLRRLPQASATWSYTDILFGGSLTMVAAAIDTARVFIGHDSGPLHIASALGVPSVGVFSPGEPERTFPQGIGAWRIIARSSPGEITASDIVAEARFLLQSQ